MKIYVANIDARRYLKQKKFCGSIFPSLVSAWQRCSPLLRSLPALTAAPGTSFSGEITLWESISSDAKERTQPEIHPLIGNPSPRTRCSRWLGTALSSSGSPRPLFVLWVRPPALHLQWRNSRSSSLRMPLVQLIASPWLKLSKRTTEDRTSLQVRDSSSLSSVFPTTPHLTYVKISTLQCMDRKWK